MMANGRAIFGMDRENRFGPMDPLMKAIGKTGLLKVTESLYILTGTLMKATGITIKPSVMAAFQMLKVLLASVNGKMTCNMGSVWQKWLTTLLIWATIRKV